LSILLALAVLVGWRASTRRTAAEIADLRARLDAVTVPHVVRHSVNDEPHVAEFLITDVGTEHEPAATEVSSRLVLSATVGEPLVRFAALAHGVRRALTAENRNRIRFEMRRELRRARKARRAAGRAAAAEARSQAVRS
ncbi:MAG: hypothetical protein ACTHOG_10330, partial [Marmoricola sp.]